MIALRPKIDRLKKDPLGAVRGKLRGSSRRLSRWYRETHGFRFSWPLHDISRYFLNREAMQLYGIEKARMAPDPVQSQVINELRSKGISVIHFNDLFPDQELSKLQQLAEMQLTNSRNREIMEAAEAAKRKGPSGKFYLVTLLGETPVLDLNDRWMQLSLSPELLGIACRYLQMLARLIYVQLWYNMPTDGPDVASQRWHRDPEDRRLLKVFLYLRDVDEHHGPFCYRPETQNGGRFDRVYRQKINRYNYPPDGAIDKILPGSTPQICTGKAGTMIFCDTTGFHKGGHVVKDARLLFNAVYTTSAGVPVITKKKYYSVSNLGNAVLSPAAEYALGHLDKPAHYEAPAPSIAKDPRGLNNL